jgi:anti-sigma-K factor RskA
MNLIENIQTSGLLEAYVLGQLSEKEMQGVTCLTNTYPEIKTEIDALQIALGKYTQEYEKQPPAFLKDKIFGQMTFDEPIADPAPASEPQIIDNQVRFEPTIETQTKTIIPLWSKFAAAASVLLAVFGIWQYSQNAKLNTEQTAQKNQLNVKNSLLAAFQNADNKVLNLAGSGDKSQSAVTVFWNQKDNTVALNVRNLPKPEAGKQYQLWIIDEKGPIDMGMLETDFEGKLLNMKAVGSKPKAFAITLEKAGGVPSPTLEQLYVIANV